MISPLPLLLLAAQVAAPAQSTGSGTTAIGRVTATIISAERVDTRTPPRRDAKTKVQYRHRDNVPMVEYY